MLYWSRHPPVHLTVQSIYYLLGGEIPDQPQAGTPRRAGAGSTSSAAAGPAQDDDAELGALVRQFGNGETRKFVMPVRML